MSKKIKLVLSYKDRPDLHSLFRDYMRNAPSRTHRRLRNFGNGVLIDMDDQEYADIVAYWNACGWGEIPDEDDECIIYPPMKPNTKRDNKRDKKKDVYTEYWNQEEREERWNRNLTGRYGKREKKKHRKRSSRARIVDINEPVDGFIGDDYNLDDIHYDRCDDGKKIVFYFDYHDKFDCTVFSDLLEFSDFCERSGYFVPSYIQDDIIYRNESHCCLNPLAKERGILEVMSEGSYGEMFYEACEESELGG